MLKIALKFLLAMALVYWLIHSGRIDFSILAKSFEDGGRWALCLTLLVTNIFLITWRWKKILEIKSLQRFSFFAILKLTWIGNLFNTVLPGAVSGDIIKLIYAHKIDKNLTKTYLVASVLMDRFIGLFSLMLIMGLFSLFNYNKVLVYSPKVAGIIHFNLLITLGMIGAFSLLFIPKLLQEACLETLGRVPLVGKTLTKTLPQIWIMGERRSLLLGITLLGMLIHLLNIFAFWTLSWPFLQYLAPDTPPLSLMMALTFIPLGLITTALPITPAGLGVGHAAFSTLFADFGFKNGASLFNFHFLASVMINLLGIIPYLSGGVRETSKDVAEFETLSS